MEKIKNAATLWLILFVITVCNAQNTISDTHKKLSNTHSLITKKNEELNTGAIKDYKKFVNELGALLETAKKEEINLEKKQTTKEKEASKTFQDAIKKSHANAMNYFKAMKEEAAKPKPDLLKIKENAKLVNSQIKEAEKKNSEMSKKNIK
jgi:hypothetical protein